MHFFAPGERPQSLTDLAMANEQVTHCRDNHRVVVEAIRRRGTGRAQAIWREHIGGVRDACLIACRGAAVPRDGIAVHS